MKHSGRNHKDQLQSPCTRQCSLDSKGICTGCYRTIGEITVWGSVDDAARKEILGRAARRRMDAGAGISRR